MPKALRSKVSIRRAAARDEKRWRELFDGYCVFYKRPLSEPLTRHTWERIMDDLSPIHAIVAEKRNEGVVGIANYVIHEHTLGLTPVCYLGDLFVDPAQRAAGVGERLIAWLVAEMKREAAAKPDQKEGRSPKQDSVPVHRKASRHQGWRLRRMKL